MKTKRELSDTLEAERQTLELQLIAEQSKTFTIDENETNESVIAEVEQSISNWQGGIEAITKRINQIDIELTMLCVGGLV